MGECAEMNIKTMQLAELTPADYNPRQIEKDNLDALAASVETFGYLQPVVWNEQTGNVVSGHQRLKVLERQGVTEAEVVIVNWDLETRRRRTSRSIRPSCKASSGRRTCRSS